MVLNSLDLRHVLRGLRRAPVFTRACGGSHACGVDADAARLDPNVVLRHE